MNTAKYPSAGCQRAATAMIVATAWSLPAWGFDLGSGLQWERNKPFKLDLDWRAPPETEHGAAAKSPMADWRRQEASSHDHGDWRVAARYRSDTLKTDFDVYWTHFHTRLPQSYTQAGLDMESPPKPAPRQRYDEDDDLLHPETTRLVGASFATTLDKTSLGGGVEVYQNAPVSNQPLASSQDNADDNHSKPLLYSMVNTVQTRLSAAYALPATVFWDSATVLFAVGKLRRTALTSSAGFTDPSLGSQSRAAQVLFTPFWQETLPNLNISLPISIGYGAKGQGPFPGATGIYKGVRFSFGIVGIYQKTWTMDLRYTHFFQADTSDQGLPDRNFIWLTLQRTF